MSGSIDQLACELGEVLLERQLMIATVESCTGGFIAEAITRVAGSSQWFERGLVTYSNAAKRELVGVNEKTLRTHGAVSSKVAQEMAIGGVRSSSADLAISVTGIAGPDGGSKQKPVGTVYVAWAERSGRVIDRRFLFAGDRHAIRQHTVNSALVGAIRFLKDSG